MSQYYKLAGPGRKEPNQVLVAYWQQSMSAWGPGLILEIAPRQDAKLQGTLYDIVTRNPGMPASVKSLRIPDSWVVPAPRAQVVLAAGEYSAFMDPITKKLTVTKV